MIDESGRLTQHVWGGPAEDFAIEDKFAGRSIYLRVNYQGNVVLGTKEGVYVLDASEFLAFSDHLHLMQPVYSRGDMAEQSQAETKISD